MNATEDECHFVLACPVYRNLRNELLPKYYCRWPTKQKFVQLMGSSSAVVLNKLAKYIYLAFVLRSSILWFHPFWFAFLNQNCPVLLFVCIACLFCIHVLPIEGNETLYVFRQIKELELKKKKMNWKKKKLNWTIKKNETELQSWIDMIDLFISEMSYVKLWSFSSDDNSVPKCYKHLTSCLKYV